MQLWFVSTRGHQCSTVQVNNKKKLKKKKLTLLCPEVMLYHEKTNFIFHFSGNSIDNPWPHFFVKESNILSFISLQIARYAASIFSISVMFWNYIFHIKISYSGLHVFPHVANNHELQRAEYFFKREIIFQREKWTINYVWSVSHVYFKLPTFQQIVTKWSDSFLFR